MSGHIKAQAFSISDLLFFEPRFNCSAVGLTITTCNKIKGEIFVCKKKTFYWQMYRKFKKVFVADVAACRALKFFVVD